MTKPIVCPVCRGTCRLDLTAGDDFKKWAKENAKISRDAPLPEWYILVRRILGVKSVRIIYS